MRAHPLNVTYLVLGLSFLGIAGCWGLTEAGVVDARAGWVLPLVLVVAGGVGLIASLARGLNRPRSYDAQSLEVDADDTVDDTADDTVDSGHDENGVDDGDSTAVYGDLPDEEPTRPLDDR